MLATVLIFCGLAVLLVPVAALAQGFPIAALLTPQQQVWVLAILSILGGIQALCNGVGYALTTLYPPDSKWYALGRTILGGVHKADPVLAEAKKMVTPQAPAQSGHIITTVLVFIAIAAFTVLCGCAELSKAQASANGVQVSGTVTLPDGSFYAVTGTAQQACVSSPKWYHIPNTPFDCDEGGCLTIAPSGSNATITCRITQYPQDTFPIMVALPNLPSPQAKPSTTSK